MLTYFFPKLKDNIVIKYINRFIYSKYYIFLMGLLTLLTNIFGFEIIEYYFIISISVVFPALFSDDMLPIIAPLAMTYSSVSIKSNDYREDVSLFSGSSKINLIVIAVVIAVFVIGRLVFDLITNPERRKVRPQLLAGYLFLFAGFMLAGVFSNYFEFKGVFYPLLVFSSISIPYFILLYIIDWKKVHAEHFMWVMSTYGIAVSLEVIYMVIVTKSGSDMFISWYGEMYTGWGMRNNIAGQIALCAAAPMYLALKKKYPLAFLWMPVLMIGACLLINSRGGSVTATLIFIAGLVIFLMKTNNRARIETGILYGAVILAGVVFAIVKKDVFFDLFGRFFSYDLKNIDIAKLTEGRIDTWKHGIAHFGENELFGVGFYQCEDYIFGNFSTGFVPARYHNTIVQLLAATGLFGFCAYVFHRCQTLMMTFKKPTLEKTFIFFTVAALLISSLTDNHFFNIGPGLNYCIALAFIEGECIKKHATEAQQN